jgi:hypothetical protein
MDDLKKFELHPVESNQQAPSDPLQTPQRSRLVTKQRSGKIKTKTVGIIALLLVVVVVLFVIFVIALPAKKAYVSAQKTIAQARIAYAAIKQQNITTASDELIKTKKSLEETKADVDAMAYMRYIPLANLYYNDADHMIKAGLSGIDAALLVVDSVKPYADVLGLKGQGSFVGGSAEQRIQTAVLTLGKITPRIDGISEKLVVAREELDKVDANHYPQFLGGAKIKQQLTMAQSVADQGVVFVNEARPLIKVLPSLLGEKTEKKYLVLFQNDKELRATGGFITAYSVFRIEKGIIHVDTSNDIYELDSSIANKPKAPDPILKYLPKVSVLNLRDSNLSPDYIESMKQFNELYAKARLKTNIDGIIALDTHVLVSTIKILDDEIQAGGLTFNTKEDKRCNCPQVIYELEDNISRPVNYIKTDRKGLLGSLLYAIMQKALKSSPKIYWGPLIQDMIKQTNEKHVLFYLYDKDAQSGLEALNAAGRIQAFEGDYLHINDVNFAGAKSNLYVTQAVDQDYSVASDGKITKKITITYKNPFPPSDCDLEHGALCLNATLRDWIRIYVPKGSVMGKSSGSEVKMSTSEDLGKTVFEGFLTVSPQGSKIFTLEYTLPFTLKQGSPLPLLIQKQPGTDANAYTVTTNGKHKQQFDLTTDKELKLSF